MSKGVPVGYKPALFRTRDGLLLLGLLLAAGLCWLWLRPQGENATAVITQDGQERYRIALQTVREPYRLEFDGDYPAVLLVEPDGVRFESADCPDQICVRTGKLTQPGQMAICLPARLTVQLIGGEPTVDGYTGT